MTAFTSLSSITKWDGPKLTGSANFAEWKQYIIAVCVPAEVYYLLESIEVKHTSAVSKRIDPTEKKSALRRKQTRPSISDGYGVCSSPLSKAPSLCVSPSRQRILRRSTPSSCGKNFTKDTTKLTVFEQVASEINSTV